MTERTLTTLWSWCGLSVPIIPDLGSALHFMMPPPLTLAGAHARKVFLVLPALSFIQMYK